ncbi:uncharacterized protein FIBRA_01412 [Fibroporia radiculosa]|uniref:Uncharacterized protein n=1 Tax=Fibroporia radiculosa TaxID=599839 RepID=J4H138_9APHY|nr:uncharacterized protein FIBRA_01412 [Fibroporia radiculosa]CCL99394.1 predicted protein [Fibroporia radiculosa]
MTPARELFAVRGQMAMVKSCQQSVVRSSSEHEGAIALFVNVSPVRHRMCGAEICAAGKGQAHGAVGSRAASRNGGVGPLGPLRQQRRHHQSPPAFPTPRHSADLSSPVPSPHAFVRSAAAMEPSRPFWLEATGAAGSACVVLASEDELGSDAMGRTQLDADSDGSHPVVHRRQGDQAAVDPQDPPRAQSLRCPRTARDDMLASAGAPYCALSTVPPPPCVVRRAGNDHRVAVSRRCPGASAVGALGVSAVLRWWPHLSPCSGVVWTVAASLQLSSHIDRDRTRCESMCSPLSPSPSQAGELGGSTDHERKRQLGDLSIWAAA